jgi:glucan phosphoethanolaminetransferase (alkaline phosphatase superfamily)
VAADRDRPAPHSGVAVRAARDDSRQWLRAWIGASCTVAVTATLIDGILLQRKRAFFTGGFLSVDHIKTISQGLTFIAASLASDVAILGLIVALVLWLAGRLRVGRSAAWIAAVLIGIGVVVSADILTYQLVSYLGDAFDFGLMFDLTGRSPMEILAVTSSHVARYALAAVVVVAVLSVAGWWAVKRFRSTLALRVSVGRAFAVPLLVLVIVAAVTTVARVQSDVLDDGLKRKLSGRITGTVVDRLSDVDRDGFGILGRIRDPDPFNANINPYALDIPGDGIDQDGVGGDLSSAAGLYADGPDRAPRWRSRRDVVLVLLESFRADAVGRIVNDGKPDAKPVTPVLDALAAQGAGARYAFSHNGYTVQSRRHVFTGSVADARGPSTLVDDFKSNGYETAYFSGQDDSFGGPSESVGEERADVRFDARSAQRERYTTFATPGSLAVPASVVLQRVQAFLGSRDQRRPLFLYVNFHDTHFPYHYRGIEPLVSTDTLDQFDIGPSRVETLRSMYYNTAANVDRAIGELLTSVRRALGRDVAVIVLSDHGESLYDNGFLGHGYALDNAQTRIPFIAAGLPLVVREPFAQSDLRDALWKALDASDETAPPRIVPDRRKSVFQYLGSVDRPAQIASTWIDHQIIYDFRSGKVSSREGVWMRPADLDPATSAGFLSLVHMWEAMKLARAKS